MLPRCFALLAAVSAVGLAAAKAPPVPIVPVTHMQSVLVKPSATVESAPVGTPVTHVESVPVGQPCATPCCAVHCCEPPKICAPQLDKKKTHVCYSCKCEEFCLPKCSCWMIFKKRGCESCFECGKVRKRNLLIKHIREEECAVLTCKPTMVPCVVEHIVVPNGGPAQTMPAASEPPAAPPPPPAPTPGKNEPLKLMPKPVAK